MLTEAEKPRIVNPVTVPESKVKKPRVGVDLHEFVVFPASDSVNGCLSPPTLLGVLGALAVSFNSATLQASWKNRLESGETG